MTRQFDAAVDVALEIERELRVLIRRQAEPPVFHCRVPLRGRRLYEAVESRKERLAEEHNSAHSAPAHTSDT